MKTSHNTILLTVLLLVSGAAFAQDAAAVARGMARFQHTCEPCHGKGVGDDGRAMLPGTDALRIKYQGSLPPALEDRSDLTAEVLKTYVRMGSWSMPPFRKTELADAEIVDIAAYLAESSRKSP
jgi:mono/diheme cytochrome c family protein